MISFSDKKILLIAPKFFGYENAIAENIKNKCAECIFYDERANPSTFDKICIRLNYRSLLKRKIESFYNSIITKYEANYFDFVIFLNPETITLDLLQKLKQKQNKAVFVLYMWDSFENKPHTKELLPFFDKKLSFNKMDCEKENLIFRPLFFIDEYNADKNPKNDKISDIDIGFIGTVHSDRYKILKTVEEWAKNNNLKTNYYLYFPSKIVYYKYKIENMAKIKVSKKDFHFVSLNSKQVRDFLCKCKVVIDIQHPKQTGLTMRTIEMLGLKKKLITTNNDIKNYDFYHKDNIQIIDRNDIKIDKSFIISNYNEETDPYRQNYSIDSFVNELLN